MVACRKCFRARARFDRRSRVFILPVAVGMIRAFAVSLSSPQEYESAMTGQSDCVGRQVAYIILQMNGCLFIQKRILSLPLYTSTGTPDYVPKN